MSSAAFGRRKSGSGVPTSGKNATTDARQSLKGNARRLRPGEAESDNSLDSRKGSVEPPSEAHEAGSRAKYQASSPSVQPRSASLVHALEKTPSHHGKSEALMRQHGFSPPSRSESDGSRRQRRASGTVGDTALGGSPKQRGRPWCVASPSASRGAVHRHSSAPAGPSPASSVSAQNVGSPTSPLSVSSPASPQWQSRERSSLSAPRIATPRGKFVPWVDASHKPASLEFAKWNSDSRLSASSSVSKGVLSASAAKRGSNPTSGVASARQSPRQSRSTSAPSLTGDASPIKAAGARRQRRTMGQDASGVHAASSTSPIHAATSVAELLSNVEPHEGFVTSSGGSAGGLTSKVPPLQLCRALGKTESCPGTPRLTAGRDGLGVAGSVADDQSDQQTLLGDTPRSSIADLGQSGEGLHESAKLRSLERSHPGQMSLQPAVSKELLHGQGPYLQGRSPNRQSKDRPWSPGGMGSADGDSTTTGGFEPETPQSCACNDASSPRPRGVSPGVLSAGFDFEQDRRAMIMHWSREQAKTAAEATQKSSKASKPGMQLQGTPSGCDERLSNEELPFSGIPARAPFSQIGPPNLTEVRESPSHALAGAADAATQLATLSQETAPVVERYGDKAGLDEMQDMLMARWPPQSRACGSSTPSPWAEYEALESYAARRARDEGVFAPAASPTGSSTSLQVAKTAAAGFPSSAVKRRQGDYYSLRQKAVPKFDGGAAGLAMTYAARRALDEAAPSNYGVFPEQGSAASSAQRPRASSAGSLKRSGNETPPSSTSPNSTTFPSMKFEGAAGLPNSYAKRRFLDERPENPLHGRMMSGQQLKTLLVDPGYGPCPLDANHLESTVAGEERGGDAAQCCSPGGRAASAAGDGAAGRPSWDLGSQSEGRSVASLLRHSSGAAGMQADTPSTVKSISIRRTQDDYTGGGPSVLRGAVPMITARASASAARDDFLAHRQQSPTTSERSQTRTMPGESSDWPMQNDLSKPFSPQGAGASLPVKPKNLLHYIQVTGTQPTQEDFASERDSDTPTRQRYSLDVLSSCWGHNARRELTYPHPDTEMHRMLGNKVKTYGRGYADWQESAAGNYSRPPLSARGISCSRVDCNQDDAEGWAIPCVTGESLRGYEEETPLCLMRRKKSEAVQSPSEWSQKMALQRHQMVLRYDTRSTSEPPPQRSSWNPLTQESPRDQLLDSSRAGKPSHAREVGTPRQWSKQRHGEMSGSQMASAIMNTGFHQAAQDRADRFTRDPAFAEQCLTMHRLKAEQTQTAASIKERMESTNGVASRLRWD